MIRLAASTDNPQLKEAILDILEKHASTQSLRILNRKENWVHIGDEIHSRNV